MSRDDAPPTGGDDVRSAGEGDAQPAGVTGRPDLLVLRGIRKRFSDVDAVRDVDLAVAPGSRTAIVGPSGAGKTTLLRIIAGFESPDAGTVTLDGRLLADGARAVEAHARNIGYVSQDGALFPHLTVEANIGFGLASQSTSRASRAARARELIDLVALDPGLLARWPHELSGGQQQRVALARALARWPSLMLLDEPFSALDTDLRAATRRAVAQLLASQGITTILVTHDRSEALSFADQVAVMRGARLVRAGSPEELYWRPGDEGIAGFLGDAILLPAVVRDGRARTMLGTIAADVDDAIGDATVMLRPEQIELVAASADDPADGEPASPRFVVVDVEFGGSLCEVAIRPLDDPARTPLAVRAFGHRMPARGAVVRLRVGGQAHVLRGATAARPSPRP